jgi:hypothetical protein
MIPGTVNTPTRTLHVREQSMNNVNAPYMYHSMPVVPEMPFKPDLPLPGAALDDRSGAPALAA